MFVNFPFGEKSGTCKSLLNQETPILMHRSFQLLRQRCRYYWSLSLKRCHWSLHSYLSPVHMVRFTILHSRTLHLFMTFCLQPPHPWEVKLSSSYIAQFLVFHCSRTKQTNAPEIWIHQYISDSTMTKWDLSLRCKDALHMQIHKCDSPP
jgi:hypothetical protein